jgi:hypothetical protein
VPVRLLLALLLPVSLPAQLHLTVRVGIADHGGHARDASDPDEPTFGPGVAGNGFFAIGVDRGPWRLALVTGRESPDLVLVGHTSGIITRDALAAWHGGLELGRRVVGPAGAPSIHLLAGVGITRWSFPGFEDPARNRLGGWLALDGALPLAARLHGILRLELMSSSSLFEEADLPEGFESLAARRIALSLGIRWRR